MSERPLDNPPHLISCYGEMTSALGRLASRAWREEPASSTAAVARDLEAAIRALLADLAPSHDVLKKALYSGSSRVLSDIFEIHGVQPYLDIHFVKPISFSEPLKRGDLAQLRMLHAAGFDLSGYMRAMLKQVRRHESPDYLSFLRDDLGSKDRFCDLIEANQLLDHVPDFLVPVLARELRDTLGINGLDPLSRSLVLTRTGLPLKHLALLIHVGRPLKPLLHRAMPGADRDPLARIVHLGLSAHGRMELHRLEPSLEDILSRAPSDRFYGIAAATGRALTVQWYAEATKGTR